MQRIANKAWEGLPLRRRFEMKRTMVGLAFLLGVALTAWSAGAADFVQTNLVSDISGLAEVTDPNLSNPWGVSNSTTSPFWVSNQKTNTATIYAVGPTGTTATTIPIPVNIPKTASGPQGPTGQVNNGNTSSFPVGNGGDNASAQFIFANLNGTISAWDSITGPFVQATTPGAVYTGLAINTAQTRLYAANDSGSGSIDVFGSAFQSVNLGANAFKDPAIAGLIPFNVQDINGKVYVTYAPSGHANQTAAPLGAGAVAIFNEDGTLIQTLINGGQLAAPWGLALAPTGWGPFGGDLLVGNFSYAHSEINAYDVVYGILRGTIPINAGGHNPGGLWSLSFGNQGNPNTLYFTDGINGETDGLFGAISAVPEPSTFPLLGVGLLGVCGFCRRRARCL